MADVPDQVGLAKQLDGMAAEANRCGLSYDLFVDKFSAAVDDAFTPGEPMREQALVLARARGYESPEERARTQDELADMGYCSHGLDPNCCPAGCGDLDDFSDLG